MPRRPKAQELSEGQYRRWDLAIKWIGVPVLMMGGMFTWYQYYDSKELNHRLRQQAAERERLTPLWNEQQVLTKRLFDTAGEMIAGDIASRPAIESSFWKLYYGGLQSTLEPGSSGRQYADEVANCLQRKCDNVDLANLSERYGRMVQAEREQMINNYMRHSEGLRPKP